MGAWPGNIRELQNVMERAVVLSAAPTLRLDKDFEPMVASEGSLEPAEIPAQEVEPPLGLRTLEEVQRSHILAALQQAHGVVDASAPGTAIMTTSPYP